MFLYIVRKTDDSGQDDDSVSIISNEIDDVEEETEQIQYSILHKNVFGIRRRRTKVIEKSTQINDIETAKDALEDIQIEPNSLEAYPFCCTDINPPNARNKVKYTMFILFGITGCYLSYKFIPVYIVSQI